jgi:predicted membrane-bound spermidine synthase
LATHQLLEAQVIPLLYLLFVLSGAAGLFYESVWSRYLSLFVGHGAYAQVIVLVIFLGGMALGAALVSRRSEKLRDPLYGYAMIELAIGLVGLVFHDLLYLPVTNWAYDTLFPALGGGSAVGVAKWSLAGLLILPQSILLGATFPLMSAGVIRRAPARPGTVLSFLYFTNSLGAAAGVLIAGFYLLKLAGLPGTLLAAAIINMVVGLVALFVAKLRPPEVSPESVATEAPAIETDAGLLAGTTLRRLLLFVACGTAFASFVYEVAWIRLLSMVLGSATHSFELMLSAFILGLALGAFWIRRRTEGLTRPLAALAGVQVAMGASAIMSLWFYHESFYWMADLMAAVGRTSQGYAVFNLARYGLCLLIMLPATFCAGMTLPLITRTLLVSGSGERAIGAVYSWNTFGSILGVSAASLLFIPLLGLKGALIFGGLLDMALGVVIALLLLKRGAPVRRLVTLSGLLVVVAPVSMALGVKLDRALLSSGVFRTGKIARGMPVDFYEDGRTATISMIRAAEQGRMNIATNGKPDGSLDPVWFKACTPSDSLRSMGGDDPTQVLLPLVTLAHHPRARSVAVIGHGTGMSSHTLLASPDIESLVTIEIEPVMVEGSRHFLPANRRVFEDPRSVHAFTDAKAYFAAANRRFDIIMAEPSNPWVSGVSGLFTTEFYSRVKRYMAPGGILGQWLHTYELSDELVLSIFSAVHRNFVDYRVYTVNNSDLLIVAVAEGRAPDPDWSVFGLPHLQQDLCHFHPITRPELDALLLTSRSVLAPLLDEAPAVNSDYYPVLDLGAERARFMGASARGINGLIGGDFDFSGPDAVPVLRADSLRFSTLVQVPRIHALMESSSLRAGYAARPDTSTRLERLALPNESIRRWLAAVRDGRPAGNWMLWSREFSAAFTSWHDGSRGWVDPAFIDPIRAWLGRVDAPEPVRAVVDFREHLVRGRYADAAPAARILLQEVRGGRLWIERERMRDGAVIAFLAAGDPGRAHEALIQFTPDSLSNQDFRTRLLRAYINRPDARETGHAIPNP